ncbi:molybdopterin molybdotransferase MoeA [Nocardioides sp. BP30]|uniref:molybdotransferase-like divisome protein Glp n=1 Tax=Nocardioides sp. BP30 TaxID=3036374 RepID=UPI0024696612|nr:gephyrin-like molybdotransferase Glp [Nocardioides sp. BP30]WGL51878.1 molybdopterin molybdotransferase MoeA [Nocardioides sp. BP30]
MSEASPIVPVSPDEHCQRILEAVEPMAAFPQPLMDALGLACAEDVHASVSLPGFDNSAMDGYAVRFDDVADASPEGPLQLPVVGEIGAGTARVHALAPGTAVKIMTGAPVPTGADTIVPYEATDRGVGQVLISEAPREEGQHVRRAGGDVAEGDLVVVEGTVLDARHLGLLAAVGRATVSVRPRPRVVVISTGSELREPGQPLGHDSIYDSNSYLLAAAARAAGAIAFRVGIVPDEPHAFRTALHDQLVRADLVITSGGVSQGDYDVVKEALTPDGVWFGPVSMQPGKPQGFGLVGEDRVPIFCLPGNPVSSFVSFEVFVRPALRRLMGFQPYRRPPIRARLSVPMSSPAGRRQYMRGRYADGVVTPIGNPASHMLGSLAESNCLLVVPEEVTAVPAGAEVDVLLIEHGHENGLG